MYNIIDKLGGALSVIGDILVELEEYANDDDLRRNLNTAICNNRRRDLIDFIELLRKKEE